jgi:hypothetical protein
MKKNMGVLDRAIRLILAIVIVILFLTKQITGAAAIILGIIAAIFILTSLVGLCPLYIPFGMKTTKKEGPPPTA